MGVLIFEIICLVVCLITSIACFARANKETNEGQKQISKFIACFFLIATLILAAMSIYLYSTGITDPTPSYSTSTQKEKCSWCGKMVSKSNMQGNWCKDCQNSAFGKDGWYNN